MRSPTGTPCGRGWLGLRVFASSGSSCACLQLLSRRCPPFLGIVAGMSLKRKDPPSPHDSDMEQDRSMRQIPVGPPHMSHAATRQLFDQIYAPDSAASAGQVASRAATSCKKAPDVVVPAATPAASSLKDTSGLEPPVQEGDAVAATEHPVYGSPPTRHPPYPPPFPTQPVRYTEGVRYIGRRPIDLRSRSQDDDLRSRSGGEDKGKRKAEEGGTQAASSLGHTSGFEPPVSKPHLATVPKSPPTKSPPRDAYYYENAHLRRPSVAGPPPPKAPPPGYGEIGPPPTKVAPAHQTQGVFFPPDPPPPGQPQEGR